MESAGAINFLETKYVIDTDKRDVVEIHVDEENIKDRLPLILRYDSRGYAKIRIRDGIVLHKKRHNKEGPPVLTPVPQCA